ncbi:hypothetical protein [Ornithinibacillus californiensis]|uniref:hypothetical protein n=1 Tax=Ornithinibacillus californiensis TaxID=161536 RepID=UPI00064DACDE|nr:hypothetical protein [Ornithinibacillus californiensis]
MKKFNYLSLVTLFFTVLFLSGCNERVDNYYLSLMGESDSWELTNYEVVLTQEDFKAGNGTLRFKNENNYKTDWFEVITHVVINNKDTVVNHNIESGPGTVLTEKSTGGIEGPAYLDENNAPITMDDVDEIYMVVKWNDNNNQKVEEKIDLYNKVNKERSFLH